MNASPITTLERVAEQLPQEQRERFLTLVAGFKQVPEDDEYLLTLEAIGFMTLLWHDVPKQISKILAGAQPAKAPTQENLAQCVHQAVKESITLPSHEDLRRLIHELEEHQTKFSHAVKGFDDRRPAPQGQGGMLLLGIILGLIAAVTGIFFIEPTLRSYLPDRHGKRTMTTELGRAQETYIYGHLEDRVLCQA